MNVPFQVKSGNFYCHFNHIMCATKCKQCKTKKTILNKTVQDRYTYPVLVLGPDGPHDRIA